MTRRIRMILSMILTVVMVCVSVPSFTEEAVVSEGNAAPEILTEKTDNFSTALSPNDKIRTERQKILSALLSHTPADNEAGLRAFTADFPDELERLLISGSCHGTGIDQINIRRLIERYNLITGLLEKFQHGLGIILIHLATKGMGSDGFHG